MKNLLFLALMILSVSSLSAQQISLFDSDGEARAYIDYDEDATIFLWDGTPVAFVEKDGNDLCVFGFNGSFLGWYEDGIIYDKNGYAVGARKGAVNMMTKMERMKGMQKMTPMRPMTPMTPMQPMWKSSWSNTSLTEFLYYGKK
ncbi:MAG: hypothetical protein KA807_20595 [Prolixibacteraceae bacterium]|nr:hypothetical protein [Prolixibacteraceae bacterium]